MKNIKMINKLYLVTALFLLAFGVAVGYILGQNSNLYQGETAKSWAMKAASNMKASMEYSQKLSNLNKKYASMSAELQTLFNAPTPTAKVQYIDKTPSRPNLSSCALEGNFYFCPADNCYYNPNGTPTGECKIPPMGEF